MLVASAVFFYAFAIQGTIHAESPEGFNFGVPFGSLGENYPADALLCVGAVWTLLLGLLLVFIPKAKADPYGTAPKRRGGFAAIVDAGPVILALPSSPELVVFKPSDKEYEEVAVITVADSSTYAHPVIAGNRIFVKDEQTLAMCVLE